jgi:uncharacterized protein YbjT (DUF2867 family)
MIAVIAGASGLVGSELLKLLLGDPAVTQVIAVGRRPLGVNSSKLREVLIKDLGDLLSVAGQLKGDVYFSCLGTTIKSAGSQEAFRKVDFRAISDFGSVAQKNGARGFVLISATGADANSRIFYNRVKGETENFMKGLGLNSLTIAQPGLLMGERKEHRGSEAFFISAMRILTPVLPEAVVSRVATDVPRLAQALLEAGKASKPGVHILAAKDLT